MVQKTEEKTTYYFVDEAGDPNFYGKGKKVIVGQEGCSRTLILGYIAVEEPDPIRQRIGELRNQIAQDAYLKEIPSLKKTLRAFHAKDDCPEVKMMVYKLLRDLDFVAQMRVARKIERMFRNKYGGKENLFYDDLVRRLFKNVLHKSSRNMICFAQRGNKPRQHALKNAIFRSIEDFSQRWKADVNVKVEVSTALPSDEPLLQVIDYANWAVQRAFERSQMRYFNFLREKYELIVDEFDLDKYQARESNFYGRKNNPFDIKKVSPLG